MYLTYNIRLISTTLELFVLGIFTVRFRELVVKKNTISDKTAPFKRKWRQVEVILLYNNLLPEGEYIGTRELRPAQEIIIKHILALQITSCAPHMRPTKILCLSVFHTKGPYLAGSRREIYS